MNIMAVDPSKIDGIWPLLAPLVQRVIDTQKKHGAIVDNTLTLEQTKEFIRDKKCIALVIFEDETVVAMVLTEITKTEDGQSLILNNMSGTRIKEWGIKLLTTLTNIAKHKECDDIRVYMVRGGWGRALKPYGFKLIGDRDYAGTQYPCLSKEVDYANALSGW